MRAPRTIIYLISLYCIISGIIFITLSVVSICAFACAFDFSGSPLTYMMYLLYFRREACLKRSSIVWEILEFEYGDTGVEPELPDTTAAVIRTLVFSIFYLILNLTLIVGAFRAMSGVSKTSKNRHFLFWSYFSVLVISLAAIIVLDFLSSAFYMVEFFLIFFNPNHIATFMEIKNKEDFENLFNSSSSIRSLPSMIFFLVTSKFFVILILNIAILYTLFTTAWKICVDNQKQVLKVHTLSKKRPSGSVMSIKSLDSVQEKPPKFETIVVAPQKRAAPQKPQISAPEPPPRTNSIESEMETFSATLDIPFPGSRSLNGDTTVEEANLRSSRVPNEKSEVNYKLQYYNQNRQSDTHF